MRLLFHGHHNRKNVDMFTYLHVYVFVRKLLIAVRRDASFHFRVDRVPCEMLVAVLDNPVVQAALQ